MTDPRSTQLGSSSSAGWLPSPAGEAAPPVRHKEPVRPDAASVDVRSLPLTRWGPRHIPVVGPTEALRGRAGGPGVAVPRGAVHGLLGHERQSSWQLAERVWRESGVDWEDAPEPPAPDAYEPEPPAPDSNEPEPDEPDPYEPAGDEPQAGLTDPHPTRPDLTVIPVQAAADSRLGMGPWPVQQSPGPEPDLRDQGPASQVPPLPSQAPSLPRRVPRAPAEWNAGWKEHPRGGPPVQPGPDDNGQAAPRPPAFAASARFAVPPAFAAPRGLGTPPSLSPPPLNIPLSAPVASAAPVAPVAPVAPAASPTGEPDELFRAWQGSVREAASRGAPRVGGRPAGTGQPRTGQPRTGQPRTGQPRAGRRAWQAARIGIPAAVIVTVGAGALMMLTGRADNMLAQRSATSPAAGQPAASQGTPLSGYLGEHGTVEVAAMWSAGGSTLAVGYADGHPAVWRHASSDTWTLVSAAVFGGLPGHLTSVTQGPSGWIAVGSANEDGSVEPVVFGSADGVTWQPLTALTALAGSDAQFLGVAAGPGGYLVVGKQGTGSGERAAFWWSADLKNWVSGTGMSAPSYAAAAVAAGGGFVAVGSMSGYHAIWTSPDGRNWTEHDLAEPSGAQAATLLTAAAGSGGRLVAAGSATRGGADIPIVITSADDGAHLTQVVLSAPDGPATVTGVTATSDGFVAVGLAGPDSDQHPVAWTSPDGLTWTAAVQVPAAGTSAITALVGQGSTVTAAAQRGAAPAVLTIPVG